MLIVAGFITIEDEGREAFFQAVVPVVAATRAEAGCQEYTFSPDPDDPNRIMLFEIWDDQASLTDHLASPHIEQWRQTSKDLPVTGSEVKKYMISEVGPVQ